MADRAHGTYGPVPEVDDGLEPPTIRAGLMLGLGLGAIVFIIVAMALLYGVYGLKLSNRNGEPAQAFPEPRLETSINPRNMPSTPEPGPAPLKLRRPPVEPAGDVQRAEQVVAARGARALDPLAPPAPSDTSAVGRSVQ